MRDQVCSINTKTFGVLLPRFWILQYGDTSDAFHRHRSCHLMSWMFRVIASCGVPCVMEVLVFYMPTHIHPPLCHWDLQSELFFRAFASYRVVLMHLHDSPVRCWCTLNTLRTAGEGQWRPSFPDSLCLKALCSPWFPSNFNTLQWSKIHQA